MSKLGDKLWHKRLNGFEAFDEVRLYVVPRFKTSGLSGDEWRQSIAIDFYFKGEKVHEGGGYRDMKTAMMFLASDTAKASDHGIPRQVLKLEETQCDQPSCREKAIGRLRIKQEFSERGEKLDTTDTTMQYFRRFCAKHIKRGDCSREDSDDNYEALDGVGADASTNREESPAAVMMPDGTIVHPTPTPNSKA